MALAAGGFAVLVLLVAVWFFTAALVAGEQGKLNQLQAKNAATRKAIAEYRVFEREKAEVAAKQGIVDTALSGAIPWYKLLNELALVIPSDTWLTELSADQAKGVAFTARSVDSASTSPTTGHKPVAKFLVRLSMIPMLSDVWLTSSTRTETEGYVDFQASASVKPPASSSAVPAPPTAPSSGG